MTLSKNLFHKVQGYLSRFDTPKLWRHCVFSLVSIPIIILGVIYHKRTQVSSEDIKNTITREEVSLRFSSLPLEAKSFVVYDVANQRLLAGNNEDEVVPLASLTKLATALTAFSSINEGVTVRIPEGGGADFTLRPGQIWPLGELAKYMLTFSSNLAASTIGDQGGGPLFIQKMNAVSRGIEPHFMFTNPSGLDSGNVAGGLGTARGVALLMAEVEGKIPGIFEATSKDRVTVRTTTTTLSGIPNTNQDVETFTGVIGSKTGYTDEAGGNLAIMYDLALGRPIIIVVLGSGRETRFSDMKKLYDLTNEILRNK